MLDAKASTRRSEEGGRCYWLLLPVGIDVDRFDTYLQQLEVLMAA